MKRALLFVVFASQLLGYKSVSFTGTDTANMTVPNNAPFTAVNDYRVVVRFHDVTIPASGQVNLLHAGVWSFFIRSTGALCGANAVDGEPGRGNATCIPYTTGMDVTLRLQRLANYGFQGSPGAQMMDAFDNGAKASITSNISGNTSQAWGGVPIDTVVANRSAVGTNAIGGSGVAFQVAYVKWFSTTVQPGTPIFESEQTAADVSDQVFEGSAANSVASSISWSSIGAGVTYPTSKIETPVCQIQNQTFRAGLISSALINTSYPLNGDSSIARQYWTQTAGQNQLILRPSSISATPTLGAGVAGAPSYRFTLSVYDSSGNGSTCTANYGFVATDSNYTVTTGDPKKDIIIGPAVMYGQNPITYMDNRTQAEDAMQIGLLASAYGGTSPPWNTAGPGTITVTQGSGNIVGDASTTFQTTFCGGTTTPTATAAITIWYPSTANPSGFGRRRMGVFSCTDQQHMTLGVLGAQTATVALWNPNNVSQTPPTSGTGAVSGLHYSLSDTNADNNAWYGQNSRWNFYESSNALYLGWARVGDDAKHTAFSTFMKNWMDYVFDWGNNYFWGDSNAAQDIYWAPQAIAMYALDGNPAAWPALETFETYAWTGLSPHLAEWSENKMTGICGEVCDDRSSSYHMRVAAVTALYDPNTTPAATARSHLASYMNAFANTKDLSGLPQSFPYGGVLYYYDQGGSGAGNANSWLSNSTISCTNGSPTCTCASGTCAFVAGWCNSTIEWGFTTIGLTRPTNNTQFLPHVYTPSSCTATTVTLDRNFQDPSGTYGWMVGEWAPGNPIVGFGTQTYEAGMIIGTLDLARQALTCTGGAGVPANCDLNLPGQIATWEKAMTDWLQTYSYNSTTHAPYYYAGFIDNCLTPAGDSANTCILGGNLTAGQAREDAGPLMDGVIRGYMLNPSAALKSFGDMLTSAEWGRPGFSVLPGYSTDLNWASGYDDGYGGNMSGALPQGLNAKSYGMAFGHGHGPAWIGARQGGLQAPQNLTLYVSGNIAHVPGATKMQVIVTEPTGTVDAPVVCTSSPCAVTANKTLGGVNIAVNYLNNSNAVVASGTPYPVILQ